MMLPAGPDQAREQMDGDWTLTTHRNRGSTPHDPPGLQDALLEPVRGAGTSGLSSLHSTAWHACGPQLCSPGFVSKLTDLEPCRRLANQ